MRVSTILPVFEFWKEIDVKRKEIKARYFIPKSI
jgi:hypothetical protein